MPQNVRNFWIEARIDGKAVPIAAGPQAKGGGFRLNIKMRNQGGITTPIRIDGIADPVTGALTLNIGDESGAVFKTVKTTR